MLISIPPNRFDEWLALPVSESSSDPRFEVLRARPDEFEQIYDCVDAAFGTRRSRALYEWIYRRNPYGPAAVWYVKETSSGRVVKTGASFPWPIWRGDVARRGVLAGDAATVPDWQRKGLSAIRRVVSQSHPWFGTAVAIAEPNEGSRVVSTKAGDGAMIHGPLNGGIAVLRAGPVLARRGVPNALARPAGALATPGFTAWRMLGARSPRSVRLEQVDRFSSEFDELTLRTMRFPQYWCPHNAEFLNWRYLDHPTESYAAFALVEGEQPAGYSVLRLSGHEATLSEFAVHEDRAGALLSHTLSVARDAGCAWVNFFASPSWRHWPSFRKAGFVPYRSAHHFLAVDYQDRQASASVSAWQVTPGDRDYH